MVDREKVIDGLKRCSRVEKKYGCDLCKYNRNGDEKNGYDCIAELTHDALRIIEEHLGVKPRKVKAMGQTVIMCGNCNANLLNGMLFCPMCGKDVDWSD